MTPEIITVLDDLASFLATHSVGEVGKSLFKSNLPATPIRAVALIPQGGPKRPGDPLRRLNLQVLARSDHDQYKIGMAKAQDVYNLLNHKVVRTTAVRCRIVPDHEPGPYFRDANNRYVFTLNFRVVVTPVAW